MRVRHARHDSRDGWRVVGAHATWRVVVGHVGSAVGRRWTRLRVVAVLRGRCASLLSGAAEVKVRWSRVVRRVLPHGKGRVGCARVGAVGWHGRRVRWVRGAIASKLVLSVGRVRRLLLLLLLLWLLLLLLRRLRPVVSSSSSSARSS